jgi:hypothetical protein
MAHLIRQVVLLATGARTTTQTLGPYSNPDDSGDVTALDVVVDLTAFTTAASLTLSIEEFVENDAVGGGNWRPSIAAAALTATGQARLRIGPAYSNVASASLGDHLGRRYRIVVTHGNGNSHTYSVTAEKVYGRC